MKTTKTANLSRPSSSPGSHLALGDVFTRRDVIHQCDLVFGGQGHVGDATDEAGRELLERALGQLADGQASCEGDMSRSEKKE